MKWTRRLGLIFLLFTGCITNRSESIPMLNYVPEDALAIVRINNLNQCKTLLHENAFLQDLSNTETHKAVNEHLKALKYLAHEHESVLAFVPSEGTQFLYISPTTESLIDSLHLDPDSLSQRIIRNKDFNTIELEDRTLYSATSGGNTLISSSSDVLLDQLNAASSREVPSTLLSLYQAAGTDKPASLFLRSRQGQVLLDSQLEDSGSVQLNRLTDWISMDIDPTSRQLNLSGALIATDSSSILNLFRNVPPLAHKTPGFAPAEASAILSYTFEDHAAFTANQLQFLKQPTSLDTLFNTVEEVGIFYMQEKKGIILSTFGTENINLFLEQIRAGTEDYLGNEIISLSQNEFLNVHFNPLIKDYNAQHYTMLENAFVFAEEKGMLRTVIRNFNQGNTFSKTREFASVEKTLANESNILFVSKNKGVSPLLEDDFSQSLQKDMKTRKLNDYAYACQVIGDDSFYHTNILIQKLSEIEDPRSTFPLFSVSLDAKLATEPQFVINHNTRKKEIVVQDENNVLYLISTSGNVLWKKELSSPIQGKIQQVDLYKNGRLQLAFTTNDQFFVIDRNGKVVQPFEKTYEGGNLNPLAIFDYEQNRKYRLVVTQGRKVFMYNSRGDIVSGFTYTEAGDEIQGAPKHFRVGNKDYLVFKLADGSLKILNRIGKVR
ncbi:MAG: ribonuclease HII, partial [Eudoraea sp.]|nr:ribonuclease HII [Eudoraea sp.]